MVALKIVVALDSTLSNDKVEHKRAARVSYKPISRGGQLGSQQAWFASRLT